MGPHADDHSMSYFDLRDAIAQPGCPVCRLKTDSADRFLDSLLWESVNDPEKRARIRRARGFCYQHFWGLARASASLGVAIIANDVLANLLRTLEGGAFDSLPVMSLRRVQEAVDSKQPSAATADLVERLEPEAPCSACEWAGKMEAIYVDTLVRSLVEPNGVRAVYEASDGLCLPHFRQALTRVRKATAYDVLVEAQQVVWQRLADHLGESISKSDYRRQGEKWGEEAGAWLRGIAALVGARPDDKGKRDRDYAWSFRRQEDS
jgi:hypothetical protein